MKYCSIYLGNTDTHYQNIYLMLNILDGRPGCFPYTPILMTIKFNHGKHTCSCRRQVQIPDQIFTAWFSIYFIFRHFKQASIKGSVHQPSTQWNPLVHSSCFPSFINYWRNRLLHSVELPDKMVFDLRKNIQNCSWNAKQRIVIRSCIYLCLSLIKFFLTHIVSECATFFMKMFESRGFHEKLWQPELLVVRR